MENKKIPYKRAEKVLAKRDSYVGVVLEEMGDKLKILLEGNEMAQKRIDRLDGRVGALEGRVDRLE